MATALSFLTDPRHEPAPRPDVAEVIASLARREVPWLCLEWLASAGALPHNFAPSDRVDIEEAFYELFAATGMERRFGPVISFYCQFDDMLHMTTWTEEKDPTYHTDWIHELVHATGHSSRLGRDLPLAFGPHVDEREDLVAEIATAIVCLDLGFAPRSLHPEFISSWISLLRADPAALNLALRQARDAAAYLFELRDAHAAAFRLWDAAERAREQAEEAGWAAERRLERQRERKRWALRYATVKVSGERSSARRPGDSL